MILYPVMAAWRSVIMHEEIKLTNSDRRRMAIMVILPCDLSGPLAHITPPVFENNVDMKRVWIPWIFITSPPEPNIAYGVLMDSERCLAL